MATFHDNSFKAPWGGSFVGLKGVYWRMGTKASSSHDSGWSRSEYPTKSNAMIANKLATISRRRIAFLNFSIAFSLSSCL